jgi:hypothetical protein
MCRKIKSDELSLGRITRLLNLSKVYDYFEVTTAFTQWNESLSFKPYVTIVRVREGNNKPFETSKTKYTVKQVFIQKSHVRIITSLLVEFLKYIKHL